MTKINLEELVSLCKRRGFIYQGSEIYGGLSGTWDFGPLGTQLKRNIINLWWETFVENRVDIFGLDSAILMNQKVWQASGHITGFNDPMVECTNCHSRFREDHLDKAKACPVCGAKNKFSQPTLFNMMFKTFIGPTSIGPLVDEHGEVDVNVETGNQLLAFDPRDISYLRPETAQGIFTNYKNILDSIYPDIPFGLAQVGKSFRNEISPRDFVFRSREFEQMEIEYFVEPGSWETAFDKWRKDINNFLFEVLGLPKDSVHEHDVPEADRAHYSKKTIDFEFDFPHKRDELLGLAYRTDFDLKNHQQATGKSLEYKPKDGGKPFIPHVIEPSFGVERLIMAVLVSAYNEDEQNGEKRTYLKLPLNLAPVKVAVFPLLQNKSELVAKAKSVYESLKTDMGGVMWDDNGNIGKRYRRQDEIGTPYCVTIDFQTLEDGTVTLRNRDTTNQKRVKAEELSKEIT